MYVCVCVCVCVYIHDKYTQYTTLCKLFILDAINHN